MKKIAALAATAFVVIAGSQLVSTVGATQNVSAPKTVNPCCIAGAAKASLRFSQLRLAVRSNGPTKSEILVGK
jgi:hypothetical protein